VLKYSLGRTKQHLPEARVLGLLSREHMSAARRMRRTQSKSNQSAEYHARAAKVV
jgi:hypothetical protein